MLTFCTGRHFGHRLRVTTAVTAIAAILSIGLSIGSAEAQDPGGGDQVGLVRSGKTYYEITRRWVQDTSSVGARTGVLVKLCAAPGYLCEVSATPRADARTLSRIVQALASQWPPRLDRRLRLIYVGPDFRRQSMGAPTRLRASVRVFVSRIVYKDGNLNEPVDVLLTKFAKDWTLVPSHSTPIYRHRSNRTFGGAMIWVESTALTRAIIDDQSCTDRNACREISSILFDTITPNQFEQSVRTLREEPIPAAPSSAPSGSPLTDVTVTTGRPRSPHASAPIGANERPCDAVWADVSPLVPASWVAYTARPTATRMEDQVDGCELQFFPFGRPFSEGYISVRVGLACTTQPCESGSGASATRTVRRSDGIEITISASKTTLRIPVPAALDELLVVLTDVPLPRVQASVVR